jgi:hypothetical protein
MGWEPVLLLVGFETGSLRSVRVMTPLVPGQNLDRNTSEPLAPASQGIRPGKPPVVVVCYNNNICRLLLGVVL